MFYKFKCKSCGKTLEVEILIKAYDAEKGKQAGICSEERSMISPDYARNFICDFILVKGYRMEWHCDKFQ